MFKKIFLLITVLISCAPVECAHFARRAAQFAKQYPGPVVGAGLSATGYGFSKLMVNYNINNYLRMEKEQEASGSINVEVKRVIKNECARHGWTPGFIVFEDKSQFNNNMAAFSDGVITGLVVGCGWGLSAQETQSFFSAEACKFIVGHEATHARNNDISNRQKVISLQHFFQGLTWHVVRASGRGKAFSLFVSWVGTGWSYAIVCVSSLNKWQEFRADRESVERAPENRGGGIQFLSKQAEGEAQELEIIRAVVTKKANSSEEQLFPLCVQSQMVRMMTHPSSSKRIERLQAMKVDDSKSNE